MDVDHRMGNAEMFRHAQRDVHITLYAVRHQYAENTFCSECLRTEGRHYGGILSARDADHCTAGRSVRRKIITNPLYDLIFSLLRVFQHVSFLLHDIPGDANV